MGMHGGGRGGGSGGGRGGMVVDVDATCGGSSLDRHPEPA
jgi:hypothetical protein